MGFEKVLKSENGINIISFILGLGLAALFRKVCNDDNCLIIEGPPLKDVENNEAIKTNNVNEEVKKKFLKGAVIAYEQIITSFAKGDKKSLKNLLGKEMFDDFITEKKLIQFLQWFLW